MFILPCSSVFIAFCFVRLTLTSTNEYVHTENYICNGLCIFISTHI